jgi:hypothetical protein
MSWRRTGGTSASTWETADGSDADLSLLPHCRRIGDPLSVLRLPSSRGLLAGARWLRGPRLRERTAGRTGAHAGSVAGTSDTGVGRCRDPADADLVHTRCTLDDAGVAVGVAARPQAGLGPGA